MSQKHDHSIILGDLTYKIFCIFSKYREFSDGAIREYMEYFATNVANSPTARKLQDQVDFYRSNPKTRSDYMEFHYILSEERREGRAEGFAEGRVEGRVEGRAEGLAEGLEKGLAKCERERQAQAARIAELEAKLARAESEGFVSDIQADYKP